MLCDAIKIVLAVHESVLDIVCNDYELHAGQSSGHGNVAHRTNETKRQEESRSPALCTITIN